MSSSLVAGVGDEVLVCFAFVVFFAVLCVAWLSTQVRAINSGRALYVLQFEERDSPVRVVQIVTNSSSDPPRVVSDSAAPTPDPGPVEGAASVASTVTVPPAAEESGIQAAGVTAEEGVANESSASTENTQVLSKKIIKLKYLDETQKTVSVWLSETVGEFITKNFHEEASRGQQVRLIYNGQLLRDAGKSLASYGVQENCVVHCHVTRAPTLTTTASSDERTAETTQAPSSGNGARRRGGRLNLGRFAYPVFGVNFGLLWLVAALFWHHISFTALVYLVLCSAAFGLSYFHSRAAPRGRVAG